MDERQVLTREKLKYSWKTGPVACLPTKKSYMNWPGIEPLPPEWEASDKLPEPILRLSQQVCCGVTLRQRPYIMISCFIVKEFSWVKTQVMILIMIMVYMWAVVNRLAPELFFSILAHTVYKKWINQETNMLQLWNKLHFEEKETESIYHV